MTDSKIRVSKWFDEWLHEDHIRDLDKSSVISMVAVCKYYDNYYDYREKIKYFSKQEYQEIRDNFEDYVRAILDGDYEVEEEKTPIGWKPEEYEEYWIVQNVGEVTCNLYDSNYDKKLVKHTKVFKTKEEAEFEAEKMKVTRELEKYACEYIKEKENYCLTAHYNNRELWTISIDFDIFQGYVFKRYGLYFESEERAQEAIKAVGEDRVLKYYFGVENE